jgi:hypothetical protein
MSNDLTNLDGLLGDLEKRREKARGMGGPEKLERRRNAGLMKRTHSSRPACSAPPA